MIDGAVYQLLQKIGLINGHLVMWCGNGGSAADAQHFSTELVVRYQLDRRALRSLCLSSDISLITAIANDLAMSISFLVSLKLLQGL